MATDSQYFFVVGPPGSGLTSAENVFGEFGFVHVDYVKDADLGEMVTVLKSVHTHVVFTLSRCLSDPETPILETLEKILDENPAFSMLLLDAPDNVLVSRYQASDKKHPWLGPKSELTTLAEAVTKSREAADAMRQLKQSHGSQFYSINTDTLTVEELRFKIARILGKEITKDNLTVHLTSFGYKYGIPQDAEWVFDVRFITNPFYDLNLRPMTGLDQPVHDYIFSFDGVKGYFEHWSDMMKTSLPLFQSEGKLHVYLAIGCTGGQHRSVCLTEALADSLRNAFPEYNIKVTHRELLKRGIVKPAKETAESTPT